MVVRLSNFEIRNAGQAFMLGRYAIHWHMVGNLRESFQRNVSVHHSWNRSHAPHPLHVHTWTPIFCDFKSVLHLTHFWLWCACYA